MMKVIFISPAKAIVLDKAGCYRPYAHVQRYDVY